MKISDDSAKCLRNIQKRGLCFERVRDFCFDTARYRMDARHDYGETRVISFRKANRREMSLYDTP